MSETFSAFAEKDNLAVSYAKEVDETIKSTPLPEDRLHLYISGIEAGDTRYALDGSACYALLNLSDDWMYTPATTTAPFASKSDAGNKLLRSLTAEHVAGTDLTPQIYDVYQYMKSTQTSRRHQLDDFDRTLLKSGLYGPDGTLRSFYGPYDFIAGKLNEKYDITWYLRTLATNGIDTFVPDSENLRMHELIWDDEGVDPPYFGHTFYMAEAEAKAGNSERALELSAKLSDRRKRQQIAFAIAHAIDDESQRETVYQEVLTAYSDEPIDSWDKHQLSIFYAKGGDVDTAKKYITRKHEDHESPNAWAEVYAQSGDMVARHKAITGWRKKFEDLNPQEALAAVRSVTLTDIQTDLFDRSQPHSTPTPRMFADIKEYTGYWEWKRGPTIAAVAGVLAVRGNLEATQDLVDFVKRVKYVDNGTIIRVLSGAIAALQKARFPANGQ